MASFGWLPKTIKEEEKVLELFNFFGVSNHKAWESYYFNQELKVSFRISLARINEPMAISSWLRQGELTAKKTLATTYNETALKNILPEIKKIMAIHPSDFFTQLQRICLGVGVSVVYTPCLPKAPIHGATRWLGDTPLIQLSARYKTNDKFWFTFFHEIGHVLLHGKKYISLENVKYNEQDMVKEKEADDFAIKMTFSESEEKEVLSKASLNSRDIINFAKKFQTHPAMIIGRFHKKELIHYSVGRELIKSIDLEK